MKVRAKCGLIFGGVAYKKGETFIIDDVVGYAFTWLTKHGWIEIVGAEVPADKKTVPDDDGLVVADGLPPLDEPAPVKKGKKNA